jgi:uncharacterized membrane protein YfcA
MTSFLLSLHPDLTPGFLLLFFLVALITGMAKAGISGIGLSIVPAMALIFGAKESTGILLPMLIIADIMAVIYYHRSAVWKHIIRIVPWVAVGIVAALITGNLISDMQFRLIMITVVWSMLILTILNDLRKKSGTKIPENHYFASAMGLTGGFATMIGNSAGPVFTLYFLALRLPKKEFIGTGAWLFLLMNTVKLPLHIFIWKTISLNSIILNLLAIPVIACGIFIGIKIVNLFPEKVYRYFVIVTTLITSLVLIF